MGTTVRGKEKNKMRRAEVDVAVNQAKMTAHGT